MLTLAFSLCLFFIIISPTTSTTNRCPSSTCGALDGPSRVDFPFQLTNQQPVAGCGYPGFDLFCNNNSQTALNLTSGEVIVKQINYFDQTIIVDPQFCLPNKIYDFSLNDTPFTGNSFHNYTFINCSSQGGRPPAYHGAPLYCLSGFNHTVYVLPTDLLSGIPATCRIISTLLIPAIWFGDVYSVTRLELQWYLPTCRSCELDGGTCGTKPNHPNVVVCFGGYNSKTGGLSKRAKYGLIVGLGVPGVLFIIVILCFTNERNRVQRLQQTRNIPSTISLVPNPTREPGLYRSIIESYPKRVIELEELPSLNESICSICLSNYKPREEVRTIPNCSHYFHVQCIDEWLSLNATCPVCRNNQK